MHRFIKVHFTDSKAETIGKSTALPSSLQDFFKLEPPHTEKIIFKNALVQSILSVRSNSTRILSKSFFTDARGNRS